MLSKTDTPRCEIHQPSFRQHLLNQFANDDDCQRLVLRRHVLYVFYPSILMIGDLADRVKTALHQSFVNPIDDPLRNLLRQPPRELLNKLLSEPLHQMVVIEYVGKVTHHVLSEEEEQERETHEYRIRLQRVYELFQQARLELDVQRAKQCLTGEQGISEQLLIEKYEALFVLPLSHARARSALEYLEQQGNLKNNGNRRKWGYDVLKIP